MTNKRFLTKGKILIALIAFLLMVATAGVLSTQFSGQAHAYAYAHEHEHHCCEGGCSYDIRGGFTLDDIREMFIDASSPTLSGEYEYKRIHTPDDGVITHVVPTRNNVADEQQGNKTNHSQVARLEMATKITSQQEGLNL